MGIELQKASMWKRIAAWVFDGILLCAVVVGLGFVLSSLLGYEGYSETLESAYTRYEAQYGVTFAISQDQYQAMTEAQQQNYDAAYAALSGDTDVTRAYSMMMNLALVIVTSGVLLGLLLWEIAVPLWLGNGQTLGKKLFGLCLVRSDGVKINTVQLLARTILGKFTIETMVPVLVLLFLISGILGLVGIVVLLGLLIGQALCISFTRYHSAIHDLLAGTTVVDMSSQTIFATKEELALWQNQLD